MPGDFKDVESAVDAEVDAEIASAIDWRVRGAVQAIKNQLSCGGCWAFSATSAIESAYKISKGLLSTLSEQQLIDCSRDFGTTGC